MSLAYYLRDKTLFASTVNVYRGYVIEYPNFSTQLIYYRLNLNSRLMLYSKVGQ